MFYLLNLLDWFSLFFFYYVVGVPGGLASLVEVFDAARLAVGDEEPDEEFDEVAAAADELVLIDFRPYVEIQIDRYDLDFISFHFIHSCTSRSFTYRLVFLFLFFLITMLATAAVLARAQIGSAVCSNQIRITA